ncbi:MAG: transcription termination/antitermination protein NusG [Flavisolibacter sp.]
MEQAITWYVVYTKPRWEKKVAELLSKKEIENYCPLNKVQKQWHDRKKTVYEPLFTSYVFLKASTMQLNAVRETSGIINFVYWLGKPALVKEQEIIAIRDFVDEYKNIQLEKTMVNVNDQVKIMYGPLMNREGKVIEIMNHTVKIYLPSLGYALSANVDRSNVEKILVPRRSTLPSETYQLVS